MPNQSVCIPVDVPERWRKECAIRAARLNPRNVAIEEARTPEPARIAVLRGKFHGAGQRVITVSFMDSPRRAFINKVLQYANLWQCGITFAYTQGVGDIRISRGRGGYFSYLGTDIFSIPRNRQTMNLEAFTERTPDSEFDRVVCHEFAHSLGGPHSHARKEIQDRLDREKTYRYFRRTSGWSRATVDAQIFTTLDEDDLMATEPDEDSILCYHFPGSVTRNGEPILGGAKISDRDREFMQTIYPVDAPPDPDEPDPGGPVEPLPDEGWDDLPWESNDWT